ncbi:MAG: hypothetical protein AB1546_05355, partial [bacterium]
MRHHDVAFIYGDMSPYNKAVSCHRTPKLSVDFLLRVQKRIKNNLHSLIYVKEKSIPNRDNESRKGDDKMPTQTLSAETTDMDQYLNKGIKEII